MRNVPPDTSSKSAFVNESNEDNLPMIELGAPDLNMAVALAIKVVNDGKSEADAANEIVKAHEAVAKSKLNLAEKQVESNKRAAHTELDTVRSDLKIAVAARNREKSHVVVSVPTTRKLTFPEHVQHGFIWGAMLLLYLFAVGVNKAWYVENGVASGWMAWLISAGLIGLGIAIEYGLRASKLSDQIEARILRLVAVFTLLGVLGFASSAHAAEPDVFGFGTAATQAGNTTAGATGNSASQAVTGQAITTQGSDVAASSGSIAKDSVSMKSVGLVSRFIMEIGGGYLLSAALIAFYGSVFSMKRVNELNPSFLLWTDRVNHLRERERLMVKRIAVCEQWLKAKEQAIAAYSEKSKAILMTQTNILRGN